MSASTKRSARVKEIGNFVGWLISILSGLFTLFEVLGPRSEASLGAILGGAVAGLYYLLEIWYVKYGIVAIFVGLLLFFVFPREEEKVRRRRRARRANGGAKKT